jgi:rhodanese-related sulfurtransferase
METIRTQLRVLFSAALLIATTFACDDQPNRKVDNNKVECPLGQKCDGGAGSGGFFTSGTSSTDYPVTGGTIVATGGGGVLTDAAEIDSDEVSAGDSGLGKSVDAAIDVDIAEANTNDALYVGDETPVVTDGSVEAAEANASGEPCEGGRVTGIEAKALVAQDALLLDVRTTVEFASDAIPNAINIPLDELATRLDELPEDRTIITYCSSGNRSGQAAQLLRDQGFAVCDLGPRNAWDG